MAVLPSGLRRFGHFLALTVPSAVGFRPRFLLCCSLAEKTAFTTCSYPASQNSIPVEFYSYR